MQVTHSGRDARVAQAHDRVTAILRQGDLDGGGARRDRRRTGRGLPAEREDDALVGDELNELAAHDAAAAEDHPADAAWPRVELGVRRPPVADALWVCPVGPDRLRPGADPDRVLYGRLLLVSHCASPSRWCASHALGRAI